MCKKIGFISSAFGLSLISANAFCAAGVYFSGDLGRATILNMPSTDTYGYYNTDLESRSTAFRLAMGYTKDLNSDFGLGGELGYNHYGSQTYQGATLFNSQNSLEYKYSAIDVLAKLTWHATPYFDVYGKVGVANEMVKVSGTSNLDDNNKALPEMGLGISYFATEKLAVDLAIYNTQGNDVSFNANNANNLPSIFTTLLGISYYFN